VNWPFSVTPQKKEIAALIGVSLRTIDNWAMQRTIPYIATSPTKHGFLCGGLLLTEAARRIVIAQ
jgi:hypothetical protein